MDSVWRYMLSDPETSKRKTNKGRPCLLYKNTELKMTEWKTTVNISASSQSSIAGQQNIVLADGCLCSRQQIVQKQGGCKNFCFHNFAKYLISCFAKFSWNFAKFREILNNFFKISCFTKFVQCCFAAALCRSGGGGGGRGSGERGGGTARTALCTLRADADCAYIAQLGTTEVKSVKSVKSIKFFVID